MTKVKRLDDFTEVDMAEGRLLNEIHENISLGIGQAIRSLISAVRAEGAITLTDAYIVSTAGLPHKEGEGMPLDGYLIQLRARLMPLLNADIEIDATELLDRVINAAEVVGIKLGRAAGKAEGAEQERMRIWLERDHEPWGPNERCVLIPIIAFRPASVLALKEASHDP